MPFTKNPVLLLVDVQQGFHDPSFGPRNNPGAEIQDFARPLDGEPLFTKRVNCAFVGTELEDFLRRNGYDTLVIVGISTDHCVSSTARVACDLGFTVYLADDATATHDKIDHEGRRFAAEDVHRISIASLHGESATIVTTADVLARLPGSVAA